MTDRPQRSEAGEDTSSVVAVPASCAQESLWFLDRLSPGGAVYNIPWAFDVQGRLDLRALEAALNDLVARHEVLRTTFRELEGRPVQVIAPSGAIRLAVVPLTAPGDREAELARLVEEEARAPFDLANGPLLRARVLDVGPARAVFQLTTHHIIVDGWSSGVLFSELTRAYEARVGGRPADWPPLELQYADYAVWQRKELDEGAFEAGITFWHQRLKGLDEAIELPFDRPRPERPSYRGGKVPVAFGSALSAALTALARSEGATLFMVVLTALAVLLRRHGARDPVVIGTPAANRLHAEVEHGVGFFANSLALPCDTSGNATFSQCLQRVKRMTLEAFDHQDVPFERVVDRISPIRDLGVNPLFQVMLAMQRSPALPLRLGTARLTPLEIDNGTAKFDLLLELNERSDRVDGTLEFNGDVFDRTTATRLAGRLVRVVEQAAARPDLRVGEFELLDEAERLRLTRTVAWGPVRPPAPSVVDAFRACARACADATALEMGDRVMTYGTLSARAEQLSMTLRSMGVGTQHHVGVLFDRSFELVVAILGVLESGAAYVPLEPTFPRERLAYMIEAAGVRHVVGDAALCANLLGTPGLQVVGLAPEGQVSSAARASSLPTLAVSPGAGEAAYVLFTSGSTGKPKGVRMPHGALANLIAWQRLRSGARPHRTLQFAPVGFDVSFQEIFATLTTGGTLILVDQETRRDPVLLLRHLSQARVERVFLPFVALHHLAEAAEHDDQPLALVDVITAGEQLTITPALARLFARLPDATLDNQYGPTETHVVTAYRLEGPPAQWPERPPIGTPIANARVYLVDEFGHPVPDGVPGEIVVGGVAVSLGYVGEKTPSDERFGPSPFVEGDRLYRTGDRARLDPEGRLHFLGRFDDQVKIRGHRVEPAEVEAVLSAHPSVRACAVIAQDLPTGKGLLAYVVASHGGTSDVEPLRALVRRTLPDYMMPAMFVFVGAMPLTASGKVNRRALPSPDASAPLSTSDKVSARDDLERDLVRIWEQVLGVHGIGVTDDFFALGGHSLAAARLTSAIATRVQRDVPVALLFQAPTVAQMAQALRAPTPPSAVSSIVALNKVTRPVTPVFLVHALGGGVFSYRLLAERLTRPVFGIQARLEQGVPADVDDVAATAARYVDEVRRVVPRGPYVLGGWSAGGTIALEMAQQLQARGETAALLVEIDSAPYNVGAEARRWSLDYWLRLVANVPAWIIDDLRTEGWGSLPRRLVRRVWSYVRKANALARGGNAYAAEVGGFMNTGALAKTQKQFAERLYTALRTYRPTRYDGKVLLFQAQVHPLTKLHESDRAWRGLSADVDIVPLPGNHLSVVRPPQVDTMAATLEETMQRLHLDPAP